jgi:hypothetical protein
MDLNRNPQEVDTQPVTIMPKCCSYRNRHTGRSKFCCVEQSENDCPDMPGWDNCSFPVATCDQCKPKCCTGNQ